MPLPRLGWAPARWRQNKSVSLVVILTAQMMVVLDTTIVNVALPHIQRSLGFSSSGLSWVLNAYVLTFGGLLLLGARAGDLLGRRGTFLVGIGVFSISSLAGGLATQSWMLLSARAFQGAGAALAAPTALALLSTTFPEGRERFRAIGLFTTVSAAGAATGLVAGGLLTQLASWRWVMFVNVPIGLAVLFTGAAALATSERRRGHLDLAGAVTSTAGMTAVVFGLVKAGSTGWGAPTTVISLVVGALLLGSFVQIESTAKEPILPLRVVTNRTRAAANLARGLGYAGMYGMVFFLTQFLQDVQGRSALLTGIGFLPTPISLFLSTQLTAKKLAGRMPAKLIMIIGSGLSAGGLLVATQLHAGSSYALISASLILIGAGMGMSFVSLTTAALAGVDPADAGAASGVINVGQQLGAALGLAVLVTVFDRATHSAGLGRSASAVTRGALVHGMDVTFGAASVLGLAALVIVAAAIRSSRLVPGAEDTAMTPLEAEAEVVAA